MRSGIISAAMMVVFGTLVIPSVLLWGAETRRHAHPSLYDHAVNDTLDMTLEVGSEWRTAKRNFTWQELQTEVANRLKVKRVEPWNR